MEIRIILYPAWLGLATFCVETGKRDQNHHTLRKAITNELGRTQRYANGDLAVL